jgi:hypothetical protein
MGPRAGHDTAERRKSCTAGEPTGSPSLYRLSNPDFTMSEVFREIFVIYSDNHKEHINFEQSVLRLNFVVYMQCVSFRWQNL